MASTDINFNPGAALAIGYIASFLTTLLHYFLTKRINQNGIIETNSVTFFLFVPAFLASVCAAILQAVNQTAFTGKSIDDFTVSYANLRDNNLSNIQQGGYQVAGFGIAAGLGMGAGIIVGLFYRFFGRDYENQKDILNDSYAFCMERGQNKVAEN